MKTTFQIVILALATIINFQASAQKKKPTVGILKADVSGVQFNAETISTLIRIEMSRTDSFEVIDKHDAAKLLGDAGFKADGCYGKICLSEAGKILGADFMLAATIAPYGETMMVSLNLIQVNKQFSGKTMSREFLMLPQEINTIIAMSVKELMGKELDPKIMVNLTKKFHYENAINTPKEYRLELDGPRFGAVLNTGETATIIRAPKSQGGFDAQPIMFQFGYQFEKQYLNQGELQALFEVIPTITGLDQGIFIPGLTILHGLRTNRNGWEFAFGPTIRASTYAYGAYDANGVWMREGEWKKKTDDLPGMEWRLDSRGQVMISSSFVFAFGRSFKSGNLNVPMNFFFSPSRSGARFGLSFGFNGRARD